MRTSRTRSAVAVLVALGTGFGLVACGSDGHDPGAGASPEADAAPDWVAEPWLLRFNTASGSEGEAVGAVYVHFTPSTGAATVRELPEVSERDAYADSQALMVSADQKRALLDSRVTEEDSAAGRITVYPTVPGDEVLVDLRDLTGVADLEPRGAAFDPEVAQLLRVVDSERRIWKVDLLAGTASADGELPSRAGFVFANGFDKNTGLPYIESLETPDTVPPGNGDDDVRAVERRGGTIRSVDGVEVVAGTPTTPCGFSGGFVDEDETYWLFCADTPQIQAYRLTLGAESWEKVGTASDAVVPATAGELPVVLPPPAAQ